MKKLIYCALALATGLFAASCQQENLEPVQGGNTVTFEVSVPEVATKGIGDNVSNINDLVYAVYWTEAESLLQLQQSPELQSGLNLLYQKNYTVDPFNGTGRTTVNVELLNDKNYVVLFWAQHDNVWVGESFDLRSVGYPENMTANNNNYAAFSGVSFISKSNLAGKKDVTLKRPFAQLNIGTTLPNPENFNVAIAGTSVKVKNAGTSFNLIKQVAEGEGEVSFAEAGAPTNPDREDGKLVVNNTPYTYAAMNYVFANGNVEVDYVINLGDYHGTVKNTVSEVPVAANYRTNIIGNLLTATSEYSVVLDQIWGTPETNVEVVAVSTAEDLIDAVNNIQDGAEGNIILEDNIDLGALAGMISTKAAAPTYGLLIPAGKSLVLDLNGLTLSQMVECTASYNMIENHGKLAIADSKGNGKISFMDLSQGGSSTWGSYVIGNQTGAELTLESGTIEHLGSKNWTDRPTNLPIQNYAGKVTINGGALKSPSFRSLRDFTAGGEIIINGGKFEGQVWMQGLGSGSSSLTVNGGDFYPTPEYDGSCIYITNGTNDVEVHINGGMFNTKIGCADAQKPGVNGCIKGGIFTTTAIENTNPDLIANGCATKQNEDGNWVIVPAPVKVDGGYEISNAAQLRYLAESINAGNSTYNTNIFLTADIDLKNEQWMPIGYWQTFNGTFDGQNHTISNLKHHGTEEDCYVGLFGYTENATIKNLTINNVDLKLVANDSWAGGHMGALVGNIEGTTVIENINVTGTVKIDGDLEKIGAGRIGGVVGGNTCTASFKNVVVKANEGSFVKGNSSIGGIAGQLQGVISFENCSSNIDVTAQWFAAGGIIGLAAENTTFTNCTTSGNISVLAGRADNAHDAYRVGGIAGSWDDGADNVITLSNCSTTCVLAGQSADGKTASDFDCAGYVGRGYSAVVGSKVIVNGSEYVYAGDGKYADAEGYLLIAPGLRYKDKTYEVSSAAGLVALSNTTIKGNESVKLTADIDLTGVEFNGLSAFNPEPNNTFDGQGYTVSNWTNHNNASDFGFFKSWVGTIKNLTVKNASLKTNGRSSIIAGNTYCNIENCHVVGCTIEDSYWACGLIAGLYNSGSVSNCSATNSTVKSNGGTGAIVGVVNESTGTRSFTNCVVTGCTVNNTGAYGEGYCGAMVCGMINISNSTVKFSGCELNGNTKEGQFVGDLYYAADDDITIVIE